MKKVTPGISCNQREPNVDSTFEDASLKIKMEHNHAGLEDDIPFQMGDL